MPFAESVVHTLDWQIDNRALIIALVKQRATRKNAFQDTCTDDTRPADEGEAGYSRPCSVKSKRQVRQADQSVLYLLPSSDQHGKSQNEKRSCLSGDPRMTIDSDS